VGARREHCRFGGIFLGEDATKCGGRCCEGAKFCGTLFCDRKSRNLSSRNNYATSHTLKPACGARAEQPSARAHAWKRV
jgi:hypothetical protein